MAYRSIAVRSRGESLIEILIAVFVFVTAFLMLLGVFPASNRAVARARNMNFATQVAERVMEDQVAQGYSGVTSNTGNVTIQSINNGNNVTTVFSYSVAVTDVASLNLKDVMVQVTWNQDDGVHTCRLETGVGQ